MSENAQAVLKNKFVVIIGDSGKCCFIYKIYSCILYSLVKKVLKPPVGGASYYVIIFLDVGPS